MGPKPIGFFVVEVVDVSDSFLEEDQGRISDIRFFKRKSETLPHKNSPALFKFVFAAAGWLQGRLQGRS